MTKTGISPAEPVREDLAVAADRRLARRVRRRTRARQVRGAAARDHDAAATALEHAGDDRRAAEMDAEHVRLEARSTTRRRRAARARAPPRRCRRSRRAGRSSPAWRDPARDVLSLRRRRRRARARRSRSRPVSTWSAERAVTATVMPASASSRAIEAPIPRPPPVTSATPSSAVRRHARSPPATRGSPASRGRPRPARAPSRAPRGGRSSRSASSAARRRRARAPA